jgi:hypothetical protein
VTQQRELSRYDWLQLKPILPKWTIIAIRVVLESDGTLIDIHQRMHDAGAKLKMGTIETLLRRLEDEMLIGSPDMFGDATDAPALRPGWKITQRGLDVITYEQEERALR